MTELERTKRYMNARQLAEYIDSTIGSVRQLVRQRRIPFLRVAGGRRVLFDLDEIDRWLGAYRVTVQCKADSNEQSSEPGKENER
jgi:excisionase family DNA binding protein